MPEENKSLTPQEVADILKIAKNTVYELVKRGELNGYKVGKKLRVDLDDVEEYKNRGRSIKTSVKTAAKQDKSAPPIKNDSVVICGQDPVLDILSRYLEAHPNGIRSLRSYIGSYNGIYAMYQGQAQIATAHLWDADTDEYNIPYVRKMLPGIPFIVMNLVSRMQGFYVAKGNPKSICGWEDLRRTDIRIANREKGSGSRVLLDERMRLLSVPPSSLSGYSNEYDSHLAVASAVSRGDADFGLGNETASLTVKNIEFIPLQKERYDLIIKKDDIGSLPFQALIDIVNSKEFKDEVSGIGRYDTELTGKVLFEV